MRIAYVITRADAVGGATVHVRDLAAAMRARGHEVMVFVGGAGPVTEQLACAGVPFRSLRFLRRSIHPLRDFRALAELMARLREFRPDLVSTHTAKAGWVGRAACARMGIPAIHTPHGWPFGKRMPAWHAALFEDAERLAARWCRAIICVCEHERRLALDRDVGAPGQCVVVRNGVGAVPARLHAAPAALPPRIVSVARFEAPKDHATLLRALARLSALDWQLDLVGDGPLEARSRALALHLGIGSRVHFLGYRQDVADCLSRAQIFVLSSRSEAYPRSVLEAMRAGLPVVATDVGGTAEAVESGENGVLVPPGSAVALSAALADLLENPLRRQRMGAAAHLSYELRHRLESMVESTARVYENALRDDAAARAVA